MDNVIQLTIGENQIDISEISVNRVWEIVSSYIHLLACQAKEESLTFKPNTNNVSFQKIEDGSVQVELVATEPAYVEEATICSKNLAEEIFNSTKGNLPDYLQEGYLRVQDSLRFDGHDLALRLFGSGSKIAVIRPSSAQQTPITLFDEEIAIYGKLLNVGGKTPNFHIESDFGKTYIIGGIDEETARSLGDHLYKNIGIKAIVKTSIPDLTHSTRCTFVRRLSYSEENRDERIKELRNYFKRIVGKNDDFINDILTDRGH